MEDRRCFRTNLSKLNVEFLAQFSVFLRPTSCHASFLPYCCFYDIFKVKTAGLGVVKTLKSSPYAVKNIDKDEEECYEHSHPASLIQMHQVWKEHF